MTRKTKRWSDLKLGQVPVGKLVDQFQAGNRAKRLSPATVQWYGRMLGEFLTFHNGLTLSGFDDQAAVAFLGRSASRQGRHGRPLSSQTIHGQYRALRAFSSWLCREEFTEVDELAGLPAPKRQKRVIEPLTRDEVVSLLGACDRRSELGFRNYTIVLTLYDTGIRASELLGLRLRDVKVEQGILKVLGKGDKEREVPVGADAQKSLMQYRDLWRPESQTDRFFLTDEGEPMTWGALHLMLSRLGKRVGVKVHAHLLRHSFAVSWVEDDGDPFSLQKILGHTTLDMVRNYVNLANGQIVRAHRKHSPADRLGLPQMRIVRGKKAS